MPENYQNIENKEADDQNNDEQGLTPARPAPLGRSQKIAVAVLGIFAVLIFSMWMTQFRKNINDPFAYKGEKNKQEQAATCEGPECQGDSEENLKIKDTDGDGLNDWDELNIYQTSPYLEDSDSDGFLDSQEIENDKDPNCPAGRDCYGAGILESEAGAGNAGNSEVKINSNNDFSELLNQLNNTNQDNTDLSGDGTAALENILGGGADAKSLRQMLLDYGMDENMLKELSDQDLLDAYKTTLGAE